MFDFLYGPAIAGKPRVEFLGVLFYDGPQQPPHNHAEADYHAYLVRL